MADHDPADKKQLHAQTLATWEAAQDVNSNEFDPVTVSQIASRGPVDSEKLISAYLIATQGDDWVVKREGETGVIYVLAPQVKTD